MIVQLVLLTAIASLLVSFAYTDFVAKLSLNLTSTSDNTGTQPTRKMEQDFKYFNRRVQILAKLSLNSI